MKGTPLLSSKYMVFYDIIHGYQPFKVPGLVPDWVEKNLRTVFHPTSLAMRNNSVKRGVQLQGWTVENWLNTKDPIKSLANETIENLRTAAKEGYIEIGASAYSHAILPLLSDEIVHLQIYFDVEILRKHIGEPTWFWFPEGAANKKTLQILHKSYPHLIAVIPDRALARTNYSQIAKLKHDDGAEQKVLVCNSLLKDLVMNSAYYKTKPVYVPEPVNWPAAQNMVHNPRDFKQALEQLGGNLHILPRDWENKGSADGLTPYTSGGEDLGGMKNLDVDYMLPSQTDWNTAEVVHIDELQDCSWETDVAESDPLAYWAPDTNGAHWQKLSQESKDWALRWEQMIDNYNTSFARVIEKYGGVENIIKDNALSRKVKDSFAGLMSCVPWHFLAKKEFDPDPSFAKAAWEEIVLPSYKILENDL